MDLCMDMGSTLVIRRESVIGVSSSMVRRKDMALMRTKRARLLVLLKMMWSMVQVYSNGEMDVGTRVIS